MILLSPYIGRLAIQKGLKPGNWKLYFILTWLLLEIIGVIIGMMIFDYVTNKFSIALVGYAVGLASYFIIKSNLERLPDISKEP
jgi:hypothetical protein